MISIPDNWFNCLGKTQRPTVTLTAGSASSSYADNLTNLAARLVVGGGGENRGAGRLTSQNPYKLYFQGSPDITPKDRFVLTARNGVTITARVFDIINVNNADELDVFTRCEATEVQPSGVGS